MAKALLGLASLIVLAASTPGTFDLAVRHARIVHGDGRITASATILVASGRIARIDESAAADGVPARRSIEGAGRTVVPGLIDAHVHLQPSMQAPLLENGVTTVRDLRSAIDGPGSDWAGATVAGDFTSVRAAVRQLVDAGADLIAIGPRLPPPLLAIVVQEAAARGVPVAADLGLTTAIEAASFGVTSIEHLSGIVEAAAATTGRPPRRREAAVEPGVLDTEWTTLPYDALDRVAHALLDRGVTLVPTLVRQEARLRSAASVPCAGAPLRRCAETSMPLVVQQRFVRDFARMGGHLVAGTDAGTPLVAPAGSLARELELYVEAGLAPASALRTATADAAALLGVANRVGTIAVGKDADLVILDGDPLRDITALRRIITVIRHGVVVVRRPDL
jgi:imidazolonepropionase-like amidohydrolase